ncbi:hypothetical protein [Rhodococcoides fascians]|uniref:hypothetical protein n=1 Tax=Rhodococcoides fascians TaxID=1828 RepID=UPI00050CE582|nr:hypothetical protein [Rhodococcus fascians]
MVTESTPELNSDSTAIMLIAVETWQILADRSVTPEMSPDWAKDLNGFEPISLGPYESSNEDVAVGIRYGLTDREISILVELAVIFKVRLSDESKEEEEPVLARVEQGVLMQLVNRAIEDAGPFIRETVYSTSARLRPTDPIFLPGVPATLIGADFRRVDGVETT